MRTDAEHAARMAKKKAVQDRIVAERDGEKGLLIVHTGAGKGKTTAALGMLVRAAGHGMTVGMIQFVKGAMTTGEAAIVATLPGVEFRAMGDGFTWDTQDRSADIASARAAWAEVSRMILDPRYDLVIADELNIVLRYDYLPLDEVLDVLARKPAMTHVVITGRNAPDGLIAAADLVTEMQLVKHPFREQGIKAQRGVEF